METDEQRRLRELCEIDRKIREYEQESPDRDPAPVKVADNFTAMRSIAPADARRLLRAVGKAPSDGKKSASGGG